MTVQCWVRNAELREFVRKRCGVETLTDRHRLVKVVNTMDGDLFMEWRPGAVKKAPKKKPSHRYPPTMPIGTLRGRR